MEELARQSGPGLSIAAVCAQGTGHLLPILNICTELSKRGHKVKVYMPDFDKENTEKLTRKSGSEFVPLDSQGNTEEGVKEKANKIGTIQFLLWEEIMSPALRSRPDVVLADFASPAGAAMAEEMNIPLVINIPGPLTGAHVFMGMADPSTAVNFLGLHIARQRLSIMALARFLNLKSFRTLGSKMRHHVGRGAIVLVQTVWGLDQTTPVYPNIVVTGPVLPPAADLREKLAKDHGELYKFLRASEGGAGVVYVTTGSQVKLFDWQVRARYHGLKRTKFPVVWSLKEEMQKLLPNKDDPDFFISKWTPQAELLQDPAIKVVITHCGWGGTLETLTAGKPIVAIPFFGDQPINASLLKERGVVEPIGRVPTRVGGAPNPYKEGWMTEGTVYAAVTKVMKTPSYTEAAQKLMKSSRASGGAAAAAQQVEWAGWYGTDHMKPTNFDHVTGSNPFSGCFAGLLAVGACAAAVVYLKWGLLSSLL